MVGGLFGGGFWCVGNAFDGLIVSYIPTPLHLFPSTLFHHIRYLQSQQFSRSLPLLLPIPLELHIILILLLMSFHLHHLLSYFQLIRYLKSHLLNVLLFLRRT